MIPIFVGRDERESVGLSVFCSSVWTRATQPVSITPLSARTDGTNTFTLARFLIPYYMRYYGHAIWADGSDMLCLADIAELWALRDPFKAVQVVKHDYKTQHSVKYLGQKNYDYERKNWSSLMIINAAHFAWRDKIRPDNLHEMSGEVLHRFAFIRDEHIGALPIEWNWLDEYGHREPVKIIHATNGIPVWKPYCDWWYADQWRKELKAANHFQPWEGLEP